MPGPLRTRGDGVAQAYIRKQLPHVLAADFGLSINFSQERPVTRVGTLDYSECWAWWRQRLRLQSGAGTAMEIRMVHRLSSRQACARHDVDSARTSMSGEQL